MKIIVAKSAGFCFGVNRAVLIAKKAAAQYNNCVTFGPLIHNKSVIEKLSNAGVAQVNDISEIKPGDTVIIRSHGIGKNEYNLLSAIGVNIIDATCPDVAKIHEAVKAESAAGRLVVIIGEPSHPEVRAIANWCEKYIVCQTPQEVDSWINANPENANRPIAVISQTTGLKSNFELCVKIIKKQCTSYKIFDTICNATSKRQAEAADLSDKCDAMIVIGDRHSANTKRLVDICRERCKRVFFIETAEEIDPSMLENVDLLGITAGASTPAWIIKEVAQKMSDEMIATSAAKTAEPAISKQEVSEIETKVPEETEVKESFEEMLERSIKTLYTGDRVKGIVGAITPTEVSVDLGIKQSGYIPLSELTDDPSAKMEDIVKIGDEIETYVMRVNDVEGTVMLSKKRLDSVKAWDVVEEARVAKTSLDGVVVEENKGGVVALVKGIRVFIPASQTGLPKDAPLSSLLKTKTKLRITEVNQSRRRVVGSIRAVMYEERNSRAENIWNEIEVGKTFKGTVKSLTSYGAFVDIGGIDGMVHVSELSWKRIRQPSDVLSVGDVVDVYVISFDKEKKKVSLGYKQKGENPWMKFVTTYQVGNVANVKIVKLMPFGAFAEILPGVDGLIHISQIADRRIGKPDEVLSEGQMVDAKIVDIDNEKQKVSLSIRALIEPASAAEPSKESAELAAESNEAVEE